MGKLNYISLFKKLVFIALILFIWELCSKYNIINSQVLSSPSELFNQFSILLYSGEILKDSISSLRRVLIGVLIGTLSGTAIAVLMGLIKGLKDYIEVLIELFRPIPPIAWIPIAILWFGIGDAPALFLVALGAFFPLYTNVYKAITHIEKKHINIARNFGASDTTVFFKIILPMLLPSFISGLKIGLGVGWIIVITAEMIGAQEGLGYMIQLNRTMLQTPNVIIGMIVIGILGVCFNKLINILEHFAVPWQKRIETLEN
ncbi:MAG: ABC transporter permease [Ignavibacteriales bacterium]